MLLDERIKSELLTLFPDGKVTKLRAANSSLYTEIRNIIKNRGFATIQEYLNHLGLEFVRTKKRKAYEEKLELLLNELNAAFPDKKIINFNNSKDNIHYKLSNKTYAFCREFGFNIHDFFKEHKFIEDNYHYSNYNSDETNQNDIQHIVELDKPNYKYDIETMRLLCTEYHLSQKVFSELFEVSRQAISHLIVRENKFSANWVVEKFEHGIISVFINMIKNRRTQYVNNEERFYICSNHDTTNSKFVFLYILKVEKEILIQCLFDLPNEIFRLLLEYHFHLFKQIELERLKKFIEINEETKSKNEKYYVPTNERVIINRWVKEHSSFFHDFSSFREYFKLDNFYVQRDIIHEKTRKLLESYYIQELDIVKIPTEDKNYQKVTKIANKRGQSLQEFIESYGFNYKRIPTIDLEKRKKERIEILKPYILEDGKIYLSSFDPVYAKFTILAYKSNRTLTQYLLDEFGIERYAHIHDVPPNLTPKIEKNLYTENKETGFIEKINEYYLVDNKLKTIYIPTTSGFYLQLYKYCDSLDQEIDDVINNWGFKRLRKSELNLQDDEPINKQEYERILSDIQTSINKEEIESKRNKRSRRLVALLKEMYNYQCQICGDDSIIPLIQMENGKYYVEVHHIVPIHHHDRFNDESEIILDDYKNAIVVCPQHHKVIHYHLGGFVEVKQIDNKYYFVNGKEKILIQMNHHLEENYNLTKLLVFN